MFVIVFFLLFALYDITFDLYAPGLECYHLNLTLYFICMSVTVDKSNQMRTPGRRCDGPKERGREDLWMDGSGQRDASSYENQSFIIHKKVFSFFPFFLVTFKIMLVRLNDFLTFFVCNQCECAFEKPFCVCLCVCVCVTGCV